MAESARRSVSVKLAQHTVELRPERAAYWLERKALLVADLHLGKAETFQRAGLAVPSGHGLADLQRLTKLQAVTGATELYVLGDMVHAKRGLTEKVVEVVGAWLETFPASVTLVLGNHDRNAGRLPAGWRLEQHPEPLLVDSLTLRHLPAPDSGAAVQGHLHPVVSLHSRTDALRLPCFVLEKEQLTLPAFGSFTGGAPVRRTARQLRFAVTETQVVALDRTSQRGG